MLSTSNMTVSTSNFSAVPDNIMIEILLFLSAKELLNLTRVCKRWHRLIHDRWLWKRVKLTPTPIRKTRLTKIVRTYFNEHTSAVDVCGKGCKPKSPYSMSNNVLQTMAMRCPKLISFKIADENLHDVNLNLLPSSVQHLAFSHCEIPVSSLSQCNDTFLKLKSLSFNRCPCIADKHLLRFGKLHHLESLYMVGSYRVDDDAVAHICAQFSSKLRRLALIGCAHCGDRSATLIAQHLTRLRSLELEEWTRLTPAGVDALMARTTSRGGTLRFLSVRCRQINDGGLLLSGSRIGL